MNWLIPKLQGAHSVKSRTVLVSRPKPGAEIVTSSPILWVNPSPLAPRANLGGQCDVVGKKVVVLAELGEMQNALLELDHEFDRGGFGKASVITWIDDKLGFHTGRPAYVFATHRPAKPGTVFAAPSQIAASIRQRMEAKAAAQVRHMIEAGDDGR